MATSTLKPPSTSLSAAAYSAVKLHNICFLSHSHHRRKETPFLTLRRRVHHSAKPIVQLPHRLAEKFVIFASNTDATEAAQIDSFQQQEEVQDPKQEDNLNAATAASDESDTAVAEETASVVATSLQLYRDALAHNDESRIAEIENSLKSIEDENLELQSEVATLAEELSSEKERVLRISADFAYFRKRTEKERLSLVTNAQGVVVEKLLSVLDNFERVKTQIKVETEGEEKINNSYQSISKQFVEILGSLGVVPVDTVGEPFDPSAGSGAGSKFSRMFHELFQKLYKSLFSF